MDYGTVQPWRRILLCINVSVMKLFLLILIRKRQLIPTESSVPFQRELGVWTLSLRLCSLPTSSSVNVKRNSRRFKLLRSTNTKHKASIKRVFFFSQCICCCRNDRCVLNKIIVFWIFYIQRCKYNNFFIFFLLPRLYLPWFPHSFLQRTSNVLWYTSEKKKRYKYSK